MRFAAVVLAGAVAACAAAVPARAPRHAQSWPLRNAGFESPPRPGERCPVDWSCTMHNDPDSYRFATQANAPPEGARSLCIERVKSEPWAVASQSISAAPLRGKRIRFSIALRGEGFTDAGAGPWLLVTETSGRPLLHREAVSRIGPQWQRRAIELVVPAQAEWIEVGATLQGGGRVCIDDARLDPA